MNFDWNTFCNVSVWILLLIPLLISLLVKIVNNSRKYKLELSLDKGFRYNNEANSNVEVYVNQQKIEGSVYDLRLKVANKGINDIEGSSLKKPYSIIFPDYAKILKAEIVEFPTEDKPSITINGNNLELTFGSLLKSKKSYCVDVLVSVKDENKAKYKSENIFEDLTDKIYAKDINEVSKATEEANVTSILSALYIILGTIFILFYLFLPNHLIAKEPIFDLKIKNDIIPTVKIRYYEDSVYIKSPDNLIKLSIDEFLSKKAYLIIDPKKQKEDTLDKYHCIIIGLLSLVLGIILLFLTNKKKTSSNTRNS